MRALRAGAAFVTLLALFFCSPISPPSAYGGGPSPYIIELGDVTLFPGEDELLLPVYITSPEPVLRWQFSLQFDSEIFLLDEVLIEGTKSEKLKPQFELLPYPAPYTAVRILYNPEAPLPGGTRLLAAYLHLSVNNLPPPVTGL